MSKLNSSMPSSAGIQRLVLTHVSLLAMVLLVSGCGQQGPEQPTATPPVVTESDQPVESAALDENLAAAVTPDVQLVAAQQPAAADVVVGSVNDDDLLAAGGNDSNWLMYGRTYDSNRFSELDQITNGVHSKPSSTPVWNDHTGLSCDTVSLLIWSSSLKRLLS